MYRSILNVSFTKKTNYTVINITKGESGNLRLWSIPVSNNNKKRKKKKKEFQNYQVYIIRKS